MDRQQVTVTIRHDISDGALGRYINELTKRGHQVLIVRRQDDE